MLSKERKRDIAAKYPGNVAIAAQRCDYSGAMLVSVRERGGAWSVAWVEDDG